MFKYFFFALLTATSLSFTSCGNSKAQDQDQASIPAQTVATNEVAIPQLLSRTPGLGSGDEITQVSSIYDAQVALLKQDPNHAEARIQLAELFINEARITGEHPYYYPQALNMLRGIPETAFKSQDQQFRAWYLEASVQLSLHDFAAAYATGEKARQLFPRNAGIHGILVDAKVELGAYDEAVALCDKMIAMRPDLRSYARVSYLREIHGEVEGAIEAMDMAVKAGVPGYEQTAWCRLTLGKLYATYGQAQQAEMQYRILLQERPNYPLALAGLAELQQEAGALDSAMALLDQAIALIPEVGFYEQKAELYRQLGQEDKAQALYPEILSMMEEDAAAGHNMDLELARVHLDLGQNPEKALEYAQKAAQGRENNIEVNGVLAEIYYAMEENETARKHLDLALATGSKNPELLDLDGQI